MVQASTATGAASGQLNSGVVPSSKLDVQEGSLLSRCVRDSGLVAERLMECMSALHPAQTTAGPQARMSTPDQES
jgi:hypothetical protein